MILIKRLAADDREAFEEVYRLTAAKLFGVCLNILSDRQRAEDAFQDVYCTVWRQARAFNDRRGSAMTWLVTIARNRSIDELRRTRGKGDVPIEFGLAIADIHPLASDNLETCDEYERTSTRGCVPVSTR